MKRVLFLMFVGCMGLVGCTSSSPSSPEVGSSTEDPGPRSMLGEDVMLRDLSDADRTTLCNWWSDTLGGEGRMLSCSECDGDACVDWDVTVSSLHDCLEWLSATQCEATVSQAEDCAFGQQPDLCGSPPACQLLDGC